MSQEESSLVGEKTYICLFSFFRLFCTSEICFMICWRELRRSHDTLSIWCSILILRATIAAYSSLVSLFSSLISWYLHYASSLEFRKAKGSTNSDVGKAKQILSQTSNRKGRINSLTDILEFIEKLQCLQIIDSIS